MKFDLVVIGGGPGGYVAALRAGQLKASVAVVEADEVGGTCLVRGCIPSKLLIASADRAHELRQSQPAFLPDLAKVVSRKQQVVRGLSGGIKTLFRRRQVTLVPGRGRLTSPTTVEVVKREGGTEVLEAKAVIIATGSAPIQLPTFPVDHQTVLTSDDVLNLTSVPATLAIIGGGVIGLEFASAFAHLGSKVTVYELLPEILPSEDPEVAAEVRKALEKKGVVFKLGQSVSGSAECGTEKVIVAVGRKAVWDGLGLEAAGVTTNKKGVVVNERMQTNIPSVYAIGDITGQWQLAHAASRQGIVAVHHILGHEDRMDDHAMPNAIFTHPEVASVGFSETAAKGKGLNVRSVKFPFLALGKAHAIGEPGGFVKMVVEHPSMKIVGVQMVGAHVTELLGEAGLIVQLGLTAHQVASTIHAHPTMAEAIHEAAHLALGEPIHI